MAAAGGHHPLPLVAAGGGGVRCESHDILKWTVTIAIGTYWPPS